MGMELVRNKNKSFTIRTKDTVMSLKSYRDVAAYLFDNKYQDEEIKMAFTYMHMLKHNKAIFGIYKTFMWSENE